MTFTLPRSWELLPIGEVAQVVAGGTPPSKDADCFTNPGAGISWLTPADLSGYKKKFIAQGARDLTEKGLASCSAKLMPQGAVLFSSRAPIGYVAIAGKSISTNQGFKSFVFSDVVVSDFAYYQIRYIKPEAEARATGTTFKELSGSAAARLPFLIAPMNEQRRIVNKLDTVLTRVDAVQDRLARITPLLKRFRQSILSAATSGRLTKDWRGGEAFVASSHVLRSIAQVSGGLTKNSKRDSLLLRKPYLRVANVHSNEMRLEDVQEIGLTEAEFRKTQLQVGDLLVVEGNGSLEQIGRVAMWRGELAECSHQNHLIRLSAGSNVSADFLLYFLLSPAGRAKIEAVASSTTGLHTLSVSKVGALEVNIPTLAEQAEIVRRVELLMGYADRLEARLKAAQTAAERLTPALLAKAFRGELVPQDPNDEPANELLRRLREQRAAQAPAKPTRGRKKLV